MKRNSRPFPFRFFAAAAAASLLIAVIGCGGSDHPKTIKVSGKVTFNGKPPPAEGMILFTTIQPAEGYTQHPGRGKFNTSGSYQAQTFSEADGLVPGKYRVRIECWKVAPSMDGEPGVSHVPENFQKELDIKPGDGSRTFDIDVPAT